MPHPPPPLAPHYANLTILCIKRSSDKILLNYSMCINTKRCFFHDMKMFSLCETILLASHVKQSKQKYTELFHNKHYESTCTRMIMQLRWKSMRGVPSEELQISLKVSCVLVKISLGKNKLTVNKVDFNCTSWQVHVFVISLEFVKKLTKTVNWDCL